MSIKRLSSIALPLTLYLAVACDNPKMTLVCDKTATSIDRAVCDSAYLLQLHKRIYRLHRASLSFLRKSAWRKSLDAQATWESRRATCLDKDKPNIKCLHRIYDKRVQDLENRLVEIAVEGIPKHPRKCLNALELADTHAARAWRAYLYASGAIGRADPIQAAKLMRYAARKVMITNSFNPPKDSYDASDIEPVLWDLRWISEYRDSPPIPCWMFKKYSEHAYEVFGIYYGSSQDMALQICSKETIENVPQVKALIEVMEKMYGSSRSPCTGTMLFAVHRAYRVDEIRAALNPELIEHSPEFARTRDYLSFWSIESIWNYKTYKDFLAKLATARAALRYYYLEKDFSADRATTYSKKAVDDLIRRLHPCGACFEPQGPIYKNFIDEKKARSIPPGIYLQISKDLRTNLLEHALVNNYNLNVIKSLLKSGEFDDQVILNAAVYWESMALLLDHGVSIETRNIFGKTPLFESILHGSFETTKNLIARGANVNARTYSEDKAGIYENCLALEAFERTPLMYAAWHGNAEVVRYLLEHGADRKATDSNSKMAIDYVKANHNVDSSEKKDIAALLGD